VSAIYLLIAKERVRPDVSVHPVSLEETSRPATEAWPTGLSAVVA
jgi:hypothetical protein